MGGVTNRFNDFLYCLQNQTRMLAQKCGEDVKSGVMTELHVFETNLSVNDGAFSQHYCSCNIVWKSGFLFTPAFVVKIT